jgi:hypothetical protein
LALVLALFLAGCNVRLDSDVPGCNPCRGEWSLIVLGGSSNKPPPAGYDWCTGMNRLEDWTGAELESQMCVGWSAVKTVDFSIQRNVK